MLPTQTVTRMNVELSSMNRETVPQDYSPSESAVNESHWTGDINGAPRMSLDKPSRSEALRWQDGRPSSAPVAGATGISQSRPLPRNSKARQNLHLPPFKSLGIVVPHPDFLLTPPYETDIKWNAASQDPAELPPTTPILHPTSVTSEGTTPETPHVHEFISETTTSTSTITQTPAQGAMTEEAGLDEDNVERSSWLEQTVDVACKPRPFRNRPTLTDNIQRRQLRAAMQPNTCSMCSVIHNRARSRTRPYLHRRSLLP